MRDGQGEVRKHVFHLLPSGILYEGKHVILGGGMVIHPQTLLQEVGDLQKQGIDPVPRTYIAGNAHILLNAHKEVDAHLEQERSKNGGAIGTTKSGIGPAYADKAERVGLRMDVLKKDSSVIKDECMMRVRALNARHGLKMEPDEDVHALLLAKEMLESRIRDIIRFSQQHHQRKMRFLLEGAQAHHLDNDFGSYPYVTSSDTTVHGVLKGAGLGPLQLSNCIGVTKAYCTRVGEGAFPTEALHGNGELLRKRGNEYGATTGRPRRCGWLSLSHLQEAVLLNNVRHLALTKMPKFRSEMHTGKGLGA